MRYRITELSPKCAYSKNPERTEIVLGRVVTNPLNLGGITRVNLPEIPHALIFPYAYLLNPSLRVTGLW